MTDAEFTAWTVAESQRVERVIAARNAQQAENKQRVAKEEASLIVTQQEINAASIDEAIERRTSFLDSLLRLARLKK